MKQRINKWLHKECEKREQNIFDILVKEENAYSDLCVINEKSEEYIKQLEYSGKLLEDNMKLQDDKEKVMKSLLKTNDETLKIQEQRIETLKKTIDIMSKHISELTYRLGLTDKPEEHECLMSCICVEQPGGCGKNCTSIK